MKQNGVNAYTVNCDYLIRPIYIDYIYCMVAINIFLISAGDRVRLTYRLKPIKYSVEHNIKAIITILCWPV